MRNEHKQLLPVLALRTIVPFPGQMLPLEVGRGKSLRAVNAAQQDDKRILLVPQFDASVTDPGARDLLDVGVVAELAQVMQQGAGHVTAVVRTVERVRIADWIDGLPYLAAHVEPFADLVSADDPAIVSLVERVREDLTHVLAHQARAAGEEQTEGAPEIIEVDDPDDLVHMAIGHIELPREEALLLLGEPDPEVRLRRVQGPLHRLRDVLRIGADIRTEIEDNLGAEERNKVLRQRLKSIQEELGEESDAEIDVLAARIDDAKLSPEARSAALKEISRLRYTQGGTPQYDVGRTYVEWLLDMPWQVSTEDRHDLPAARAILDADHAGLEKVKRRILEFLAVRKLAPDKHGPILCLVGPPGVGKTSLGRAIAAALGRKYVRQALGGVRDEAEIRGHRRTYIGALPGRIVAGLKKAGSNNPVFVLDEVDKLSSDFRGDPTSALLEVLDPEQNKEFTDHYLEVPADLSRVLFLCTANTLETIPAPLLDRMEIIEVPSYTIEEKREIALRHLLPKQLAEHGLEREALELDEAALEALITRYTREAGVRNLERELAAVCRAVAVEVAGGGAGGPRKVTADDLTEILGPPRFSAEEAGRQPEVGVATGMAWTPTGGEILFIEAREMPGTGELKLTGQLGDVMRESALAAFSWVRSRSEALGIPTERFSTSDLHVHLPSGGVRKDGPSAGVALTTALVSAYTGRPVRADVAITGEVTLRGRVLPVGGIKEKLMAAHRAGIHIVAVPARNQKDLIDIPASIRDDLDIRLLEKVDDALDLALGQAAGQPAAVPAIPPPTSLPAPSTGRIIGPSA